MFQVPEPTQLIQSMVRSIRASVLQERMDLLGIDGMLRDWLLLNRDKEVTIVGLSLQLQQHHQVAQLNRVLHVVYVAVNSKRDCMLSRLDMFRKILLMWSQICYESFT